MDKIDTICSLLNITKEQLKQLQEQNQDIPLDAILHYAQDMKVQNDFNEERLLTFKRNLVFFKDFDNEIYQGFKDYKPQDSFDIVKTSKNYSNIVFNKTNMPLYQDSEPYIRWDNVVKNNIDNLIFKFLDFQKKKDNYGQIHYRYFNEALDKIKSENLVHTNKVSLIKEIPHLQVMGLGLGYIVDIINKRVNVKSLLLMEPKSDIFYASLYVTDYKKVISSLLQKGCEVKFIIGLEGFDLTYACERYYRENGKFLGTFAIGIIGLEDKYYVDELSYLQDYLKLIFTSLGFCDDTLFGMSHSLNHLKRKRHLAKACIALPKGYEKSCAFVIGNGPSLDDDIAFLRKNQDKAYIIACGSAIDTLYNVGIKPDAYVATERINGIGQTLDVFDNTSFLDDIVLFTTSVVHPYTVDHFKRSIIFSKVSESIASPLATFDKYKDIEKKWASLNFTNPLVGNAGLDIATSLGFKKVYLFGLDNGSVLNNHRLHSKHSDFFNSLNMKEISDSSGNDLILEGNFGIDVRSNELYKTALDCMGLTLSCVFDVECINCSNGAKIDNTKAMHSYDLNFDSVDNLDKDKLNEYFYNEQSFVLDVDNRDILDIVSSKRFNLIVDNLIKILDVKIQNRSDLLNALILAQRYLFGLDSNKKNYVIAQSLYTTCDTFFMLITANLYSIEDEKRAVNLCKNLIKTLIYLFLDLKHIFEFMPDYIQDEHLNLLNYKIGFDHELSKAPTFDRHFHIMPNGQKNAKNKAFYKKYS